jgi:hypothetical protein
MRKISVLLFLCGTIHLNAQIDSMLLFHSIDLASIKISEEKKDIPTEYYSYVGIKSTSEIANSIENWNAGCIKSDNLPNKKFHWIATDKNGNVFISISYGGVGVWTCCYAINLKKKINIHFRNLMGFKDFIDFYTLLGERKLIILTD